MNAIEKIRHALDIKDDAVELVTVVSTGDNVVVAHGSKGNTVNLAGSWSVGTRLIIKSGVVQSVVRESGIVIYE